MEGEHTDLVVEDQQSMLSIENKVFRFFEDNEDDAGHTDVPCDDEGASRGLGNLPAGCIALILSYTSPRDVARLALVNHTFGEASGWDLVWENMLPFNYSDIVSLATDYRPLPPYSSKRDLYHLLCRQILLRDGTEVYTSCPSSFSYFNSSRLLGRLFLERRTALLFILLQLLNCIWSLLIRGLFSSLSCRECCPHFPLEQSFA